MAFVEGYAPSLRTDDDRERLVVEQRLGGILKERKREKKIYKEEALDLPTLKER